MAIIIMSFEGVSQQAVDDLIKQTLGFVPPQKRNLDYLRKSSLKSQETLLTPPTFLDLYSNTKSSSILSNKGN